jgi:hypothetical protein
MWLISRRETLMFFAVVRCHPDRIVEHACAVRAAWRSCDPAQSSGSCSRCAPRSPRSAKRWPTSAVSRRSMTADGSALQPVAWPESNSHRKRQSCICHRHNCGNQGVDCGFADLQAQLALRSFARGGKFWAD